MKRAGIYVLTIMMVLSMACGGDDPEVVESSSMFMYRVDYNTNTFEGGITFALQKLPPPLVSEIPLEIDREEADQDGDGAIAIIYEPSLDILFNGALTNFGNANIIAPTFIDPTSFQVNGQSIAFPSGITIQSIDGDHSQVDITSIWAAISNLAITEFAIEDNTKIGLFLYQPNSDPSFSDNWDWIIMIYNQ